jgi:nucleoside-diphosphate-sugar epimerase
VIGAGVTPLVGELLSAGLDVVAVDISSAAIETLRSTVGDSSHVEYVVADVRALRLAETVDAWHDRAVFHFLVEPADQQAYVAAARTAVAVGGHVVIATFAPEGPEMCSGLPVARHDAASLAACFGAGFELTESFAADHSTPWGSTQRFTHAVLRRTDW